MWPKGRTAVHALHTPHPELVDFYVKAHSPLEIWPEIVAGIKEVGITRMDIYRDGTRLVMIMEIQCLYVSFSHGYLIFFSNPRALLPRGYQRVYVDNVSEHLRHRIGEGR